MYVMSHWNQPVTVEPLLPGWILIKAIARAINLYRPRFRLALAAWQVVGDADRTNANSNLAIFN
jgi:hypothetical protein